MLGQKVQRKLEIKPILEGMKGGIGLCLTVAGVLLITACKKENWASASGDNGTSLESGGYIDLESVFTPLPDQSIVYVDNADPYGQILGFIHAGESNEIRNFQLSNLTIHSIELVCPFDFAELQTYVTDCQLIARDLDGSNQRVLATYGGLNAAESEVTMNPDMSDLTEYLKSKPDEMFFKFSFNDILTNEILVRYSIHFNCTYSYDWLNDN